VVVEEYRALAAAIRAALRKFAPDRAIALAESLAAAERLLLEDEPELLIIDLDPPQQGAVAFFDQIRDTHPKLRVLIITAGAAADAMPLPPAGALNFVTKPFELAAFAAAVERLLASGTGVPEPISSLGNLGLADMIALQTSTEASAVLLVQRGAESSGEIHFARGQMIHARTGNQTGLAAVEEMLEWRLPRFASRDKDLETPRTIQSSPHEVMTRARKPAAPRTEPSRRATATGKKILVIDDTEMLRIFVEEMLATADPTLQIVVAANGTDGLQHAAAIMPDLVLLDYSLPDINGDEVCRRLLAGEKTSRLPVLMMSGHVPEMNAAAAGFENVVATLAKPFLSSALIELVQATLQNPPPFRKQPPALDFPGGATPTPGVSAPLTDNTLAVPEEPLRQPQSAPEPVVIEASPIVEPPVTPAGGGWLESRVTPVRLAQVRNNDVILGVPLEVTSLQFSPSLQIAGIRARPTSRLVSLHIDPASVGMRLPDAGFELDGVHLDTRGQMETLRLAPANGRRAAVGPRAAVGIGDINVLRSNGYSAVQLVPTSAAPMRLRLLAPFELAAVELTPTFGVAHLVLRSGGGKMRVTLQPEAGGIRRYLRHGRGAARSLREHRGATLRCGGLAAVASLRRLVSLQELLEFVGPEVRQHITIPVKCRRFRLAGDFLQLRHLRLVRTDVDLLVLNPAFVEVIHRRLAVRAACFHIKGWRHAEESQLRRNPAAQVLAATRGRGLGTSHRHGADAFPSSKARQSGRPERAA
jgi:DNA-binding response OmpR family regulator